MSKREDDEIMFLAGVMRGPENDTPTMPSSLLTSPWRRLMLEAMRSHPGDPASALLSLTGAHQDFRWVDHYSTVEKAMLLATKHTGDQFAERVLDSHRKSLLREVFVQGARACDAGDDRSSAEIRNDAQRALAEAECGGQSSKIMHVGDVMASAVQDLRDRLSGARPVLTSGLPSLDKLLGGGFEPGWMVVVGARPKMGKTAFAGLVETANAERGIPVFGCELEMSPPQQGRRMIARRGGPTLERVRMPRVEGDMLKIEGAYHASKKLPMHFAFGCRTFDQVEAAFREWRMLHTDPQKPALGVLDYLQLAEVSGKGSREREVADMARRTKLLAKELHIPILVLSQLNRGCEQRDPPEPVASDLRESGAIEQDADVIILLYRPSVYGLPDDTGRPNERAVKISVPAQREGASGEDVWVDFIGERATFQEAQDQS